MKYTIRYSSNLRRLVVMTVALLLLGLTGVAVAKPDKPPCHPHCDDPVDPPSTVSNQAKWAGLFEEEWRAPCTTSGGSPTGGHGAYGCPVADGLYPVKYNLSDGVPSKKKDIPDYCDAFVGYKYPDYRYVYAWEGPCVGATCDVFVYNTFYGLENHSIDGVGLVHMVASGFIKGPFDNPNPFGAERVIMIEEIDITFYGQGNDRKLATCNFSGWTTNPPVLYTEPLD